MSEIKTTVGKIKKIKTSTMATYNESSDLTHSRYDEFTKELYPNGLIVFDFEVFKYDWLVVFQDCVNKKQYVIANDRTAFLKFYQIHRHEIFVGYNSRNYDVNIFKGIILGMNAKEVNDKIIFEGLKGFQISNRFSDIKLNCFDVINPSKPVSLKQLEGFMQVDIEETEVDFNLNRILTKEEMELTKKYCIHDVDFTVEVFKRRKVEFDAQMGILKTFDFPLEYVGKTKAQLTAEVTECRKPSEERKDWFDYKMNPNIQLNRYKYIYDWFMDPAHKNYENRLNTTVMGVPHQFGFGGLHAAPNKPIYKEGKIHHADITSFYPTLMLEYELLTRNSLNPNRFKKVYDMRVALKKAGKKKEQQPYKIILNSQYGMMKHKYSSAYDPRQCNSICVNGQLMILDILEHLEDAKCCELLQSNTDGIIIQTFSDENEKTMNNIINEWCERNRMSMRIDSIDFIYQKDVNNYLFKFSNGEVEVKGLYLQETDDLNNDLPLINEVLREYMLHKIDVKEYITNCNELWKFQKLFRLTSNYKSAYHNGIKYTNRTYRVFASKDLNDTYLGKQKEEGTTIAKCGGQSNHVFIENADIHGKKCTDYPQFDKQWYIDLAYKRLEDFGLDARPSIFDMF